MGNSPSTSTLSHEVANHRSNRIHRESMSDSNIDPHSGSSTEENHHHPRVYRSYSTPARQRQESCGSHHSAFSTSLEGAYSDSGDGMTPSAFGGDYHQDVPRKYRTQSFDDAHGNKLEMPVDSKLGSGFDLDWQYDPVKCRKIMAKRSINPDHPCYAWIAAQLEGQKKISAE